MYREEWCQHTGDALISRSRAFGGHSGVCVVISAWKCDRFSVLRSSVTGGSVWMQQRKILGSADPWVPMLHETKHPGIPLDVLLCAAHWVVQTAAGSAALVAQLKWISKGSRGCHRDATYHWARRWMLYFIGSALGYYILFTPVVITSDQL